jgi:hypothetical protein
MRRCNSNCVKPNYGTRIEHCTVCHESFSTTRNGDAHRKGRHGFERHCLPPESVGLVRNVRGVWMSPSVVAGVPEIAATASA